MSDIEDPVTTSPPPAYNMSIKGHGSRAKRKSRLPVDQVPTSRKTRSATKLDQDTSDRVLKDTDKKSVRKEKGFSERQTMALLNTASTNGSSTGSSPSPRRSQRLKEKAAASKRKVCSLCNSARFANNQFCNSTSIHKIFVDAEESSLMHKRSLCNIARFANNSSFAVINNALKAFQMRKNALAEKKVGYHEQSRVICAMLSEIPTHPMHTLARFMALSQGVHPDCCSGSVASAALMESDAQVSTQTICSACGSSQRGSRRGQQPHLRYLNGPAPVDPVSPIHRSHRLLPKSGCHGDA
ncbi:hypothetical protein HO173_000494 [Letharia columbiana]|uniref:Uncharacterized protein n=1 Tax=Letharia columbiana TaxID=112416 RepID=A0A8H6LAS4_9LECA|nr:uncharacterized protein HO173_000494 [Letharia columbiana]KAF6241782.1 hypothetical protein HO173_000494 [Letharia columbiana]